MRLTSSSGRSLSGVGSETSGKRRLASAVAVLLLLPAWGITSAGAGHEPAGTRAYEGDCREAVQVATLELGDADRVTVDDVTTESKEFSRVELLPGSHAIFWHVTFHVSFLVSPNMKVERESFAEVELEEGHSYALRADRSYGPGFATDMWIEDLGTGEVIAGAKKYSASELGSTPVARLVTAAGKGQVGELQQILAEGAEIDAIGPEGMTALMAAAAEDQLDAARLLLEAGAYPDVQSVDQGATALMLAAFHDHPEMARLLLEHDADVNATNTTSHMSTALMVAAAGDADATVAVLLADPRTDVNARSALGWTALMYAVDAKAYDSARLLIAHPGTDIRAQNANGESALTLARGRKMARLLSDNTPPAP